MSLILFKTRHASVAVNPAEVSDVTPYVTNAGIQTLLRMRNRVEHVVFEPMSDGLNKLNGETKP